METNVTELFKVAHFAFTYAYCFLVHRSPPHQQVNHIKQSFNVLMVSMFKMAVHMET